VSAPDQRRFHEEDMVTVADAARIVSAAFARSVAPTCPAGWWLTPTQWPSHNDSLRRSTCLAAGLANPSA
jgi:hypothetical protein